MATSPPSKLGGDGAGQHDGSHNEHRRSPAGHSQSPSCVIEIEGVSVRPGDLVFRDVDGVLIVPRELEAEVIAKSLEKARGEKLVRADIENGLSCTEAFEKYGIL